MEANSAAPACEHRWIELATMDSNPPIETRECSACERRESRAGRGVDGEGAETPVTAWSATSEVARPLEGFTLPPGHPMAGREAWQCVTCEGIFYPERVPPVVCPYCAEDAEED